MSEPAVVRTSIYVREVSIPPASPWIQRQAAGLEAATGAPLGAAALMWSVKRLSAWRPREPGRYAIGYVRVADLTQSRIEADHAGRTITFTFRPPGASRRRLLSSGPALATGLVAMLCIGLAGQRAITIRTEREIALARLESNAFKWERRERADRRTKAQVKSLRQAGADGRSFADLASDLFWLGQAKAPGLSFDQIVWRKGEMIVRSTGPGEPVVGHERPVAAAEAEKTWRIGAAPLPVVKNGLLRPSVVANRTLVGTLGEPP